ncbi:hypothetical protein [uncultured Mucilaginibacter sp.]|uniref:hypothetical protein n=1 Tax=uncultured Mucilaginibacter sp. TaxID=797541 RepID=UPI0025F1705A|nr:hypothetical protein [uncultured Mucilaginibacter sp.]
MRKNFFVILALLTIGYFSCNKNPYKAAPPLTAYSYFPQTFGSTWRYRDSIFGEATNPIALFGVKNDTLTYTMNGATTDFNSKISYDVDVSSRLFPRHIADYFVSKHIYELIEPTLAFGLIDLQILNDTAHAGYTWNSTPSLTTLLHNSPVRAINTIVETDMTKIEAGRIYTSVTHTAINFQININNQGFYNIAHFDFYLAGDVGIIEKDAYYYGYLNETQTIVDFHIK